MQAPEVYPAAGETLDASCRGPGDVGGNRATIPARHERQGRRAGETDDAALSLDVPARHCAHEFVECIVTPDVLADRDYSLAWSPECGGVDGPGLAIEQLRRTQRRHRGRN